MCAEELTLPEAVLIVGILAILAAAACSYFCFKHLYKPFHDQNLPKGR